MTAIFCCCCCTRRKAKAGQASRPLDPNSETKSEPEDERCEAEKVAYCDEAGVKVLAVQQCRDKARQAPVSLLHDDADVSDVSRIDGEAGAKVV